MSVLTIEGNTQQMFGIENLPGSKQRNLSGEERESSSSFVNWFDCPWSPAALEADGNALNGVAALSSGSATQLKIAYIGHSHHRKTGSNRFFLELLQELATVDVHWDEGWLGKDNLDLREILDRGYDLIVLYQTESHAKLLNDSGRRVLFVPMYDSCLSFSEVFWRELGGIEILCFCRRLFERLRSQGLRARYAQFFPDPAHFEVKAEPQYAGFFWQRRRENSWKTLRSLLEGSELSWINIHEACDLDCPPVTTISEADKRRFHLRFSRWSEDGKAHDEALQQAGIYFAPRLYEGIGMSFLEAMAMGKAVVAADNPTMNEYLTHNVNGYLFDPEHPRPIDLARFREMGKAARETVERGHPRWLRSREEIGSWLSGTSPKPRPIRPGRKIHSAEISVICLPSANPADLDRTCASVVVQNYSRIEHVIVSRSSPLPNANPALRYVSVPVTAGRYQTLNTAASIARGDWIIFLNAGDILLDENVLSEALEGQSTHRDFIVGHYLELRGGNEFMHWVSDFEAACQRLVAGKIDPDWLAKAPALSATLINRRILQRQSFSQRFHLAGDLDFLLRCRRNGASLHHANTTIARVCGSTRNERLMRIKEYQRILSRETLNAKAVRAFAAPYPAECEPLLKSWIQLGPLTLFLNLIRDLATARYAVRRVCSHLRFLGIRGVLDRLRQLFALRFAARRRL